MYSIRRRLTILLAAGFAVLILAAGLVMADVIGSRVTDEFDVALRAKAQALAALTESEDGRFEFDYVPEYMPEFEREDRPDYFQFWLDDGTVLLRSRRLQGDLPFAPARYGGSDTRDVRLPDGRSGRLVEKVYVPRGLDERTFVLVVARGRERLDSTLGSLRLAIFGVGGLAMLLAVLLVWRTLRTGLRPIDAIARQVGGFDAETLTSRVRLQHTPRELAPIVEQLNALLQRLEASFSRERRFAGNVAHELRTPIAELRSLAAVGSKWPGDEASTSRFFDDVGAISLHMERIVQDLLLLARCQAGVEGVVAEPTELRALVEAAVAQLEPQAQQRRVSFGVDVPVDLEVDSDPGKLAIVLTNLLGNALSHGHAGGEVRCVARVRGDHFQLDVENAAERLDPEALASLTEPFWRGDAARSPGEHAGLGLALVSVLAPLLGLELAFHQDADGTFSVRLEGRITAATFPEVG